MKKNWSPIVHQNWKKKSKNKNPLKEVRYEELERYLCRKNGTIVMAMGFPTTLIENPTNRQKMNWKSIYKIKEKIGWVLGTLNVHIVINDFHLICDMIST
jgi:hypothetical protein